MIVFSFYFILVITRYCAALFLELSPRRPYYQVMVFVHARNATVKTALTLREMAANQGDSALFRAPQGPEYGQAEKQVCCLLGGVG